MRLASRAVQQTHQKDISGGRESHLNRSVQEGQKHNRVKSQELTALSDSLVRVFGRLVVVGEVEFGILVPFLRDLAMSKTKRGARLYFYCLKGVRLYFYCRSSRHAWLLRQ